MGGGKTYYLHLKAASKYTIFLVQMCIALTIKRDVALSAFACRSAQEMQKQI